MVGELLEKQFRKMVGSEDLTKVFFNNSFLQRIPPIIKSTTAILKKTMKFFFVRYAYGL